MHPNSIYFDLKVAPNIGALGPKYLLFGYMDPKGLFTLGYRPKGSLVPPKP